MMEEVFQDPFALDGDQSKDKAIKIIEMRVSDYLIIAFLKDLLAMVPDPNHLKIWWVKLQIIELFCVNYQEATIIFNYMLSKGFIILNEGGVK